MEVGYWLLCAAFVLDHDHEKDKSSFLWNPLNASARNQWSLPDGATPQCRQDMAVPKAEMVEEGVVRM